MKRKVKVLLLAIIGIIFVTACSNSNDNNAPEVNEDEKITDSDYYDDEEDDFESDIVAESGTGDKKDSSINNRNLNFSYMSACAFNNEKAWIKFQDELNNEYLGWIDKKGKLEYYSDLLYVEDPTSCKFGDNGKTYIMGNDGDFYSIDKNAKVSRFTTEYDNRRLLNNDYVIVEAEESGFDSHALKYLIYDSNLDLIEEYEVDGDNPQSVRYYGNGIIGFFDDELYTVGDIYYAKSGKWIKNQPVSGYLLVRPGWNYNGSYLLTYAGDYDDEGRISIADDSGNVKDVSIPEDCIIDGCTPLWIDNSKENVLLLNFKMGYHYGDLFVYNVRNDSFKKLEGEYFDRILWQIDSVSLNENVAKCGKETLAVELEGKDGEVYTGFYNLETMDMICDPIPGNIYDITDNDYLIVQGSDVEVYDKTGQLVSSFSNIGSCYIGDDDSITLYADNKTWFFNKDWELLFTSDEIDFSTGKYFGFGPNQ